MKIQPRWLLASDLHFKLHDLDRVVRTADWIASIPLEHNISRVVICGDLFTARASQPTNVLSACYRFLGKLTSLVPHVDIILGNHDLAYRRDYTTSALEAMAIAPLAPFVTLHTEIACHNWDGTRVLVMPFREDQGEIIKCVRNLGPKFAAKTVGFGHLAINRAITQRHTVNPETGMPGLPSRYPGLTSASEFASLARTYTGHFHSYQTIFQTTNQNPRDPRGSMTYIGAPLQLTWADLFDTRRGVILLDPQTLEDELIDNPYAVGYTAVEAEEILADRVDVEKVRDKHTMITGNLSMYQYISARNRLVKLGVRSVRDRKNVASEWQYGQRGLGKTVLPADFQNRPDRRREEIPQGTEETPTELAGISNVAPHHSTTSRVDHEPVDLAGLVHEYVSSLHLGSTLGDRRDILSLVGKRLFNVRSCINDETGYAAQYRDILDPSPRSPLFIPASDTSRTFTAETTFAADPLAIEITNFLGVQGTLTLDFKLHFQPGVNLIVGHNGAGKSTIIEAIVWCQFGQCIRGGIGANDVINDNAGKNCNVRLTFANGYTISRSRKHKDFGNRVIVEKNGAIQPQFEGPDARSTQASIDGLLGIDFGTFIRIVLLGNESTPSFLSSTQLEKRQLIESILGLGVLDGCAQTCNSMLSQVEEELGGVQSRLEGVTHTLEHLSKRLRQTGETLRRLHDEAAYLTKKMGKLKEQHTVMLSQKESIRNKLRENLKVEELLPDLKPRLLSFQNDISLAQSEVNRLGILSRLAQARSFVDHERAMFAQEVAAIKTQLHNLEGDLLVLLEDNNMLEVPSSVERGGETIQEEGDNNLKGVLLNIKLAIRKFWTWILHTVSPAEREKARVMEEMALRAIEARRRWDGHVKAIIGLTDRVTHTQGRVVGMMDSVANLPRKIASQTRISEDDVHLALRTLTQQEALKIPGRLTGAIDELRTLSDQHAQLQREHQKQEQRRIQIQRDLEQKEKDIDMTRQAWAESFDKHRISLASKRQEISTYKGLLESETESLTTFRRQAGDLNKEVEDIHSHREIFAFWQSALARRQVARPTFRRHVIGRHLGALNKLLLQILTVMYQDAEYGRSMVNGTLKTLLGEDAGTDDGHDENEGNATPVLESSLSVAPTLGYAKKSGGERKRVDLALFFALFIMSEAKSAHRAGYMLVDEAFDGLDTAGQAAVMKLCRWMTERLTYVFVITHSQSFMGLAEGDGSSAGASVVTAKAGDKGTEFEANGVLVSSSSSGSSPSDKGKKPRKRAAQAA